MAFKHGKDAEITINSVDLSAFCDNIEWNRSRETGETTTFGSGDKTYVAGLRDATFTITGKYDSTASTGPADVLNGLLESDSAVTFEILEEGTGAGLGKITGSCLCTAYTESVPVGDVITFSADFQVTGAVTTTNQSS